MKKRVILGVDPGTRITGYGVIDLDHVAIDFGCIRPPVHLKDHERYLVIFKGIDHLLEKYQPEVVAIETQFVQKNVQSAMKLGMAKAAAMLAAALRGIEVVEYAPRKAKQAVVGHGGASKYQVQRMVQMLLKLPNLPEPEDAADALALAICHTHNMRKLCLNM